MRLRRRTRETHRHERAVVYQELGEQAAAARPVNDWQRQREIEVARMRAARKRRTTTPPEQPTGGGGSSEN